MKVFVTYGDTLFTDSRERIRKEAESIHFFDKVIVETETVVNDTEFKMAYSNKNFKEVFDHPRGGGYWLWKPYVIYKNLKSLNEGDFLFYTDAGSTIPKNRHTNEKLQSYIDILKKNKGIIAFRNQYYEKNWTKADIYKHFNCLNNSTIYNSKQFSGGRLHAIRKCDYSMKIYKLWWDTAVNYPYLFSDSKSIVPNIKGFRQNRHDQSIWSIICKTNNIHEEKSCDIPIIATKIRSDKAAAINRYYKNK